MHTCTCNIFIQTRTGQPTQRGRHKDK